MADKKYLSSQGLGKYHNKLIGQMAQDDNAVLNSSKSYTDTEISGFASEVNAAIGVVAETLDEHKELIDGKAEFRYEFVTLYSDMWYPNMGNFVNGGYYQWVPVEGITSTPEQIIVVSPVSNDAACDYINCKSQDNGKLLFNLTRNEQVKDLVFIVMYTVGSELVSSNVLDFDIDYYDNNYKSYKCPRGYTWGDFLDSSYNIDNFTYDYSKNRVAFGSDYEIYDADNEHYPKLDSKIKFCNYIFEPSWTNAPE